MKKFYKEASAVKKDEGYCITLDGKTIKTPAGNLLAMPSETLANKIVAEWDCVKEGEEIIPESMGYMKMASTAIDKVIPHTAEVCRNLMPFAMNDLLCYRSGDNLDLRTMQDGAWDKWVAWAKKFADIDLIIGEGIIPIDQSPSVKVSAMLKLQNYDGFKLTVMADLTSIYGSFVLALSAVEGKISMQDAYDISRVDELYQIQKWGVDDEAQKSTQIIKDELVVTSDFLKYI